MDCYLVIGSGAAKTWMTNASAVEPRDADLLTIARERGLYDLGAARNVCDAAGNLLDDGWLVITADIEESDFDFDPAVIAYCVTP